MPAALRRCFQQPSPLRMPSSRKGVRVGGGSVLSSWASLICLMAVLCLGDDSGQHSLADMVRTDLSRMPMCWTLINREGTTGCRSIKAGSQGLVSVLDAQEEIERFSESPPTAPHTLLLPLALITSPNLDLLASSGAVASIIIASPSPLRPSFSPSSPQPYCMCGQEAVGEKDCKGGEWNPGGLGISSKDYNFAILPLDPSATASIRAMAARAALGNTSFPRMVARLDDAMDVYSSSQLIKGGEWWQEQPSTRCCPGCTPNCGSKACCDLGGAYECRDTASKPRCLKRQKPTAAACLEDRTCLPLGGYNLWALLGPSPSLPAPPGRGIVLVSARIDSAGLFMGDMPGAARASGLTVLIAAAHALSHPHLSGGSPVLALALQGEAYGGIGSAAFTRDLGRFRCNKTAGEGAAGYPMCIDPLMLSPDISKIPPGDIAYVIEVDQPGSGSLWWHSGCSPSPSSESLGDTIISIPWGTLPNTTPVVQASPLLPLPGSSPVGSLVPSVKARGLLAGYDTHYSTRMLDSQYDVASTLNLDKLCSSAQSLAAILFTLSHLDAPSSPPPLSSIKVDCAKVAWLLAALSDPLSPDYAGTSYVGVYRPPTVSGGGPSPRETLIRDQLALASSASFSPQPEADANAACDCCNPSSSCVHAPYTSCVQRRCIASLSFFHDALPLAISYNVAKGEFSVNRSIDAPLWAESNWQGRLGGVVYIEDSPAIENLVLALGVAIALGSTLASMWVQRSVNARTKQH